LNHGALISPGKKPLPHAGRRPSASRRDRAARRMPACCGSRCRGRTPPRHRGSAAPSGSNRVLRYTDSGCVTLSPLQPRSRQMSSMALPISGPIGDLDAALPVLLESAFGGEEFVLVDAGGFSRAERRGEFFAVQPREFGLRVERVDVRRPAGHEQEDDALGRRFVMRLLRREGSPSSARPSSASVAARRVSRSRNRHCEERSAIGNGWHCVIQIRNPATLVQANLCSL